MKYLEGSGCGPIKVVPQQLRGMTEERGRLSCETWFGLDSNHDISRIQDKKCIAAQVHSTYIWVHTFIYYRFINTYFSFVFRKHWFRKYAQRWALLKAFFILISLLALEKNYINSKKISNSCTIISYEK
jgi:hypothetical protein